ncbi:hypothetical protein D8X30_14535 [Bordetella pertussis]|nr:hypothetical protein AL465_008195 [Bordetella pertussis 18323]QFB04696.1 hypothetical protein D8X34_14550 [Bordetella pertussis]QFB08294.1 hypothetical protein D8X33_14550 [Bordetella pertussis]QFB11902.1 hypothetical protein D8X32_14545 [Bordetella pertussis]QFB15494.1 hypothetical protein D8X31_14545 [Bordetella pertussis]
MVDVPQGTGLQRSGRIGNRPQRTQLAASCEDSIGCMHGSSEPDLRNWKSPTPQFTQGARPDEHP